MKRSISIKLLQIVAVFAFAFACLFIGLTLNSNVKTANADSKTYFTSTELGINGATPITYDEFVTASGATIDGSDIGFVMGKGALVRADKDTPGIRFVVNLGTGIDTIKAGATYNADAYDYDYYVLINTGDKFLFVEGAPYQNGDDYQYTAALTFDGVSNENFDDYKALVINGQGVMVVTEKADDSNKIVVLADANDNERTMEAVVNSVKLANNFDGIDQDVVDVLDSFVPCDEGTYVLGKGLYAEREDAALSYADIIGGSSVKAVYYQTKKYTVDDDPITLSDLGAAGTMVVKELNGYITVVDSEGKFHNYSTVKVADTVIRECSDLDSLSVQVMPSGIVNVTGYFIVANDVIWDGEYYARPEYEVNSWTGSWFDGVLDGDGHKVEFGISAGGLFGKLFRGTIKNISLIVKGVNPPANYMTDGNTKDSIYVILAEKAMSPDGANYAMMYNVYVTFDIEDFSPAIGLIGGSQFSWFGLFGNYVSMMYYWDVILDLSKVQGVQDLLDGGGVVPYGLFHYNNFSEFGYFQAVFNNVHVIWGVKELKTFGEIHIAENDIMDGALQYTSVYRHDNLAAFADGFNYVGNFSISADGVVWED